MVIDRLDVLKKRILEINDDIKKIKNEDQVKLGRKIDRLREQIESVCAESEEAVSNNDILKILILGQQISIFQDKYTVLREEWAKNQKKIETYRNELDSISKEMVSIGIEIANMDD